MTEDELDALIDFVNETVDAAVNDPCGESGRRYQAQRKLRERLAELSEQQKPEHCLVEPIGGKVGDVPRCAKYPDCPCGGPPPHPTANSTPPTAASSKP